MNDNDPNDPSTQPTTSWSNQPTRQTPPPDQLTTQVPQTMLVSTHDLPLVRELFPRTVIMDRGEIVADGPTESLLNDVALLEAHGLEKM